MKTYFCGSFGSFRFFAAAVVAATPVTDDFLAAAVIRDFFPVSLSFVAAVSTLTNGSDDGCWKAFCKRVEERRERLFKSIKKLSNKGCIHSIYTH